MRTPPFLLPLLDHAAAAGMRNLRNGRTIATTVETAFDSATRKRGLLGRGGLAPGTALVIAPSNLVHTFGMQFAIDLLFVARSGRAVKVLPNVPRRRVAGSLRAFAVVELPAGALAASDTRTGDTIEFFHPAY